MKIIINNSSMIPIYEQLVQQIKKQVVSQALMADTMLPSVRSLASELKISALTVKKAYDLLEEEGYVVTVHGKGTFVKGLNEGMRQEEQQKEVEKLFDVAIEKGKNYGMSNSEIRELFEIILDETKGGK